MRVKHINFEKLYIQEYLKNQKSSKFYILLWFILKNEAKWSVRFQAQQYS